MTSAPIVLVPGFWLGSWAWDEVGRRVARGRPRRHRADAARSRVGRHRPIRDHPLGPRRRDLRGGPGGERPRRARRAQRSRIRRLCRERSDPGADRGHGLRRLRAGDRRERARLRRRGEALARARGARAGGEPRRAQRGAARDVPAASGAAAGWRPARGRETDQRRAPRYSDHGHLHGVHVRAGQGRREGGPCVARRPRELRDVTWVDLPTSHWPMWSRPRELAAIIGDVATARAGGAR